MITDPHRLVMSLDLQGILEDVKSEGNLLGRSITSQRVLLEICENDDSFSSFHFHT